MPNPADLADRESALVQDALSRSCEVCKAKPGDDCFNLADGKPLPGRIVHYARTTA
ncbi:MULTISPECIES: zinc finger domain-containing protein [Mycobacterium avium complex (MAC)]|uniref:zinc finger domain-containing protein n=1 Tax=Mycobacterium avium complex (MAC) TaxID=120793 RepID=UPI0003D29A90|nr:hypothetical protein N602_03135 [Mycobacterium avium subsp. hominissuis 10-5606]